MSKGFFNVPVAVNEPVLGYVPGSPVRRELQAALKELKSKRSPKLSSKLRCVNAKPQRRIAHASPRKTTIGFSLDASQSRSGQW